MDETNLRKLGRAGLLEILVALSEENDRLKARVAELEDQLAKNELRAREAGSLATVAADVSGLLLAAQKTADLYLNNLNNIDDLNNNENLNTADAPPRAHAAAHFAAPAPAPPTSAPERPHTPRHMARGARP